MYFYQKTCIFNIDYKNKLVHLYSLISVVMYNRLTMIHGVYARFYNMGTLFS